MGNELALEGQGVKRGANPQLDQFDTGSGIVQDTDEGASPSPIRPVGNEYAIRWLFPAGEVSGGQANHSSLGRRQFARMGNELNGGAGPKLLKAHNVLMRAAHSITHLSLAAGSSRKASLFARDGPRKHGYCLCHTASILCDGRACKGL